MILRPLLSLLALALAAAPLQAETQLVNPTPRDCCECVEITVNEVANANFPGKVPLIIKRNTDGTYTLKLRARIVPKPGIECGAVRIMKIELLPETAEGPQGTVQAVPALPSGLPPGTIDYNGTVTLSGFAPRERWNVKVTCSSNATGTAEPSSYAALRCQYPLYLGSECGECDKITCEGNGSNGCFLYQIPLGQANGGDSQGTLRFFTPDQTFPGLAGLHAMVPDGIVQGVPKYTVDRKPPYYTVTTPTTIIKAVPSGAEAITITHAHPATPDDPFRTTVISKVTEGVISWLRADSTTIDGVTTRHQQRYDEPVHILQSGSFFTGGTFVAAREERRSTTSAIVGGYATETHHETIIENAITVSDVETTYTHYPTGWEKTRVVVANPGGIPLVSEWTYYSTESSGPVGEGFSSQGNGRIKSHTRYDGHEEYHYYWIANGQCIHQTVLPFAGNATGLRVTRTWSGTALTVTEEVDTGGGVFKTLSRRTTTYNQGNSTIQPSILETVETATGSGLATTTTLKKWGSDFGGQPATVTHPDGTVTNYQYTRHSGGGKTVTARTGSGGQGRVTTTTYNRYGTPVRSLEETEGYSPNAVLSHTAVTSVDDFGRPLATAYFPTSSTVPDGAVQASITGTPATITRTTYSCCGLESATDEHGVTTSYQYDGLRRQTKATTLGVTTETVHSGLTTTTHRYPAGGSAADSNRVSSTTRNLAGTVTISESPDPSNPAPGALTATTTTTTYANSLTSTTTTVGSATQVAVSYPDGRIKESSGTLAPHTVHAYTVNDIGLITASAYVDGTALREITATQTDRAGRTKATGRLRLPTDDESLQDLLASNLLAATSYSYNNLGQLAVVRDADNVVTLYGYNALGERDTTALSLNGDETIDYGTDLIPGVDRITRTETAPFARDAATTVLRTTTRVWQDGDILTSGGTLVSRSDSNPATGQSWSWSAATPDQESSTSTAPLATIGLNFTDAWPLPHVADAPADGLPAWTDSRSIWDWDANPAVQAAPFPLGTSGVSATWTASNTWAAGQETDNEQALYRVYLDDGETSPGTGVRVTLTGLSAWLASTGRTTYQIRCYANNDSDTAFQPITIRNGDQPDSPVLHTITPAALGDGSFPTVSVPPAAGPARGYVDSPDSLMADTITLTIPPRDGSSRGTLAAIRITATGAATTVPPGPDRIATTTAPDGTSTSVTYAGGRPVCTTFAAAGGAVIETRSVSYDSLGRPSLETRSRTGATTTAYVSATCDAVRSIIEENGDNDRETKFTYDSRGNRLTTTLPDTTSVTHTSYYPTGQAKATWGSLVNPIFQTYDYAGRVKTLTTFRTTPSGEPTELSDGDTTTWNYDNVTGFLLSKWDTANRGPDYQYTASGRLARRTWQRGVTTDYYYNQGGELRAVDYGDTTPDILYVHDRLGRLKTSDQGTLTVVTSTPYVGSGGITISSIRGATLTYDDTAMHLATEEVNFGGEFTKTISRSYQTTGAGLILGRPSGYTFPDGSATWSFDNAGRAASVTDGTNTFTYGYLPNSSLIQTVAGPAHAVTNTWETTRDVLATKTNTTIATANNITSSFAYGVNALGQRKTLSPVLDASDNPISTYTPKWAWNYNDRGELESADHGNDNIANDNDRAYQYDAIGNRQKTVAGLLGNLPTDPNWTANSLNQYTKANGVILPTVPATETPHDEDGNLRFDGGVNIDSESREYLWDAENRLVEVKVAGGASLVTYAYDHFSRLIARTDANGTARYLYDGWNRIAEYSGQTLQKTYLWGMDISGTMQGAGGVGGLLAVNQDGGVFYPAFDGNGNVTEYINAIGGVVAHYEYDAFGNTVSFSGTKAADFAYRFSTKPLDQTTGWFYYGYRFYDPLTGRWPSPDPLEENWETDEFNQYGFVRNNGLSYFDFLGMRNGQPARREREPGDSSALVIVSGRQVPRPPPQKILVPKRLPYIYSVDPMCDSLKDAIALANAAIRKGKCKKWFDEHSSWDFLFAVTCHGKCHPYCLLPQPMRTFPPFGDIHVCIDKAIDNWDKHGLATLLIHEVSHHYVAWVPFYEGGANDGQDACEDAILGKE